ncbi:hypothetical protein IJG72_07575 [bacterium]|nr:hypothetical protein [bacterium]
MKAEKGEYVEGAICATMHGLAKDILKDIGIPAVLVSSKVYTNKQKSSYGGHITLLYKLEDNKYVSTDYGNSNIIEADNIKAATQKLYKESNHLTGERGYIFLLGDEGQSYTEYMFQNESSYGEDIEKGNHVRESAFIKDNAKKKNAVEIKADYANTSNRKNFEIKNTVAIPKANLSIDMGASSRATDETNVLMESGSYGAMAGVAYDKKFGKKKSNRVKANADGRISRLKGKTEKNEYQVETLKNSFNLGYEHDFFNNGNTIISGGLKLSGIGSRTVDKVRNKDMRISAEAGLELKTHLGKIGYFDAEISGGAIGDYGKLQYTYQDRGFIPGFKTNLKTALTLQPSCDFSAKIDAQGYYLKSRTTEHYGVSGGVMGMLKLSDYIDLYGAIEMDYDNKNISLGLLEENIDKTSSVSSTLGVKINKNTDISINVTKGLKSDDYSTQLMFKKEF